MYKFGVLEWRSDFCQPPDEPTMSAGTFLRISAPTASMQKMSKADYMQALEKIEERWIADVKAFIARERELAFSAAPTDFPGAEGEDGM